MAKIPSAWIPDRYSMENDFGSDRISDGDESELFNGD